MPIIMTASTMNIIRIFILNAIISKIDNNILKCYSIKTAPCYKDNDIAPLYFQIIMGARLCEAFITSFVSRKAAAVDAGINNVNRI